MQTPDRKNPSIQKRVYRKAKTLIVVDQKSMATSALVSTLEVAVLDVMNTVVDSNVENNSVSSLSEPPSHSSKHDTNVAAVEDVNALKRTFAVLGDGSAKKKSRRTPKQKYDADAESIRNYNKEKQAIKMATQEIDFMKKNPGLNKLSQIKVVERINNHLGTNISSKTVSQMVREGRINVSPLKRGPAGHFPKVQWLAMCTAFVTFVKLEQANSKKQSSLNELTKKVNVMANAAKKGSQKRGMTLHQSSRRQHRINLTSITAINKRQDASFGQLMPTYKHGITSGNSS